jgi:hypothetical protein
MWKRLRLLSLVVFLSIGLLVSCISSFGVSQAHAWGSATHCYVAGEIGKELPLMNANECYGIVGPDIFNYSFDLATNPDLSEYLYSHTHGFPGHEDFMKVWEIAKLHNYQKNLAYGYVAHNDVWGMDFTAHWKAQFLSIPDGFPGEFPPGYVIIKAYQLNQVLTEDIVEWAKLLPDENLRIGLAHDLVETAVDILIARMDPKIGEKMIWSALLRGRDFPELLTKAIGKRYGGMIFSAEKEFRKTIILLGTALTQDEEAAIDSLSENMAELGVALLQMQGIDLDPDQAKALAEAGIRAAMTLCENDFAEEIHATTKFVKRNLVDHGVYYPGWR